MPEPPPVTSATLPCNTVGLKGLSGVAAIVEGRISKRRRVEAAVANFHWVGSHRGGELAAAFRCAPCGCAQQCRRGGARTTAMVNENSMGGRCSEIMKGALLAIGVAAVPSPARGKRQGREACVNPTIAAN